MVDRNRGVAVRPPAEVDRMIPRATVLAILLAAPLPACQRSPDIRTGKPAGAAAPHAAVTESTTVRSGVDTGNTNLIDAAMTGNSDLLAACFTDDGTVLLPNQAQVVGRDSIRAISRRMFTRYHVVEGTLSTTSLRQTGDDAIEMGQWRFKAGLIGRPARADSGTYQSTWKRKSNAWKLLRFVANPRGA